MEIFGGATMTKNRKITLVLAAVLLLIFCIPAGCGKKEETGKDLLARIKEKGEIVIAMEGTWAPWTYHDENDKLVGFDTEVGEAIAEILGVKAVFVEGEWDGLLAGLEVGRYDLMINGVEITDERSEKYDFTDAYAYIRTALIVGSDNNEITSFENLDGKTTANSINSTYMYLAEEYGATVLGVDTLDQTLDMVLSGRADATLNAELSFDDYMKVHPDAALKVAALTEEASHVAIPVRKGDDSKTLREAVNEAIEELRGNGKLAEISEKYFGKDITKQ